MTNSRPYWQVAVSLVFSVLATVAFVYFGLKALGFLMPFVVGWIISAIATPVVNWLEKRFKIVKNLGTALIVMVVLALIVLVLYFSISWLVSEIGGIIRNFPQFYEQLEDGFTQIGSMLSGTFEKLPKDFQASWNAVITNLDETVGSLVTKISEPTVAAAGNFAKKLPSYLIAFIVAIMSAYFFTVQKEEVVQFFKRIAPQSVEKRMSFVADTLKYAVGGYFKAQFKIMGVVFLILFVGLASLKIKYSLVIALLIAFLDFLPFLGTGTAMIPWAVYQLFMGKYKLAILLLVIYAVTQLVRQLLQPKLVGDSMGLNPLVTLLLLYVGYRFSSVIGMILAVPLGMVVINMCQAGAFDYILDDVKILVNGILGLRQKE